jgi:hypothetical protein
MSTAIAAANHPQPFGENNFDNFPQLHFPSDNYTEVSAFQLAGSNETNKSPKKGQLKIQFSME